MTAGAVATPAHTVDRFLDGMVTLLQPPRGHRAGLDAALLQALAPGDAAGHAVDLGAGVGAVAFAVAARAAALRVTAVEIDADLVACAETALAMPENAGFASRVRLVQMDAAAGKEVRRSAGLVDAGADWVLMNPPYDEPGRVRPSPDAGRRGAHLGGPELLGAWSRSAAALIKPGGLLGLIHRAAALADVLATLGGPFGDIRILPVYPSEAQPAGRIVVRARRASRGRPQLMPGLVLHRPDGSWTDAAEAILRGRAELPI